MKYSLAAAIALLGTGCAYAPPHPSSSQAANPPLTEETYRAAARHCHSSEVIRMRPGVPNVFYVGGLVDQRGRASGEGDAKRIECVRQYLGIPSKDVQIVYS